MKPKDEYQSGSPVEDDARDDIGKTSELEDDELDEEIEEEEEDEEDEEDVAIRQAWGG